MKASEIAALLDEPACAHNAKSKSGCARPKPGASAGGCAFDGAQIALLPIGDVAHIVHGPIACTGPSWDGRGARSSGPALYRTGMTTDLTDQDIIMGRGEKRLFHSIKQAVQGCSPAAVFVYNTCVPSLIGDDVEAVCKAAAEKFAVPVVPVDCAGFAGTKNLGNRIAGEAMLKHVIGTGDLPPAPAHPDPSVKTYRVNLIGEFNIAGELWRVTPLLDELGLRVICALSGDARFHQVQAMHHADVNMVVCSKALINVARKMEDRYGAPWFEGSFYGVSDVSDALRNFARIIDDDDLIARTEAVIAREEARIGAALAPWREKLAGKRALLYTGGVKSWSVVAALQELGMTVVASGSKKSTEEDKARIRELMGEDARLVDDGAPRALLRVIEDMNADILIAGGRNMYTALKARIPFLDINQEREFGYAGYDGMIELARQLSLTVNCPVWDAARRAAPWASHDAPETAAPCAPTPTARRKKALSVNPLKSSQTIGAALAFLGMHKAIPLLHGAQGCTAFAKVFFVRHFREPVPLQTTAMDLVSTVIGAETNIVEALATICDKQHPQVIGLPATELAATQGSYIERAIREFRAAHPEHAETVIVPLSPRDFGGGLETGFALALKALLAETLPDTASQRASGAISPTRQVNILAGAALTPGDLEEIKALARAFGLEPFVVPDLSDSLDGRLTANDFEPLSIGGTRVHLIAEMGRAKANLVIGASLAEAADLVEARTGAPTMRIDHAMGLGGTDALVGAFASISGRPVPKSVEKERLRLLDALLDCHFSLSTSRLAIAADPDLLKGFADLVAEAGADTVAAVASAPSPVLARVKAPAVQIGDLEDLEDMAHTDKAELLIGNTHVADAAERMGLPVLRAGFPLYDELGAFERLWVGYRGARQALYDLANGLARLHRGEIAPHISLYAPPQAAE